jgi:1-acyl-sn-glycerol-3-phosphate acyltransferase
MIWLRSVAFNAWFFGLTLVLCLVSPPVLLLGEGRALAYARFWARLVLGGLRVLCGISWEVTGLEHLPQDGPALIASQHQSAFDTMIWAVLAPRFAYVLKRELMRIPLFGALLQRSGMIAIDRAAGPAAVRALLHAADRALAGRRQVVIFPEGTRVAPGERAPLHPGVAALAARMRLPVIPVVTNSGEHWGRRAFRKRPGVIRIAVLPPLPAGLARQDLLARLAAIFSTGQSEPVENSVGEVSGRL